MGMDVCGRKPRSDTGKYFRNNIWWWHPLASFCEYVAPDITAGCKYWHSNDGDGLKAAASVALANKLQEAIDGPCGKRMERAVERGIERGPFSCENVQEFINFLRDSGGFEIN